MTAQTLRQVPHSTWQLARRPITLSVVDNDTIIDDDDTYAGGTIDNNGWLSQTTNTSIVINGTTIPSGSAVVSTTKCTFTNNTTGQSGTYYSIDIYAAGGTAYLAQVIAYSIPVHAGDSLTNGSWFDAGQTTYTSFAALTSGSLLDGYVDGTAGNDLINSSYTDASGDKIDNNDATLAGSSRNDDYVRASDGNDTVLSGMGNDQVYGGNGNDSIDGGAGNDTLFGEAGNDTLIGGAGDDTFVLATAAGGDSIVGGETGG